MQNGTVPEQGLDQRVDLPDQGGAAPRHLRADQLRPVLRALARVIASDRRPVALASSRAEVLLVNRPAQLLGLTRESLLERLDWPALCARAKRAGSAPFSWQEARQSFEGELVQLPLGPADGFLLRLSETDQEATLLRNQARAALLMRVAHDLRTPIQTLLAAVPPLLDAGSQPPKPKPKPQIEDPAMQGPQGEDLDANPAPALATRPVTGPSTDNIADPDASGQDAAQRLRRAAGLALDHISNVLAVIRGEQSGSGTADEDFRLVEEISHLVEMVQPIARARSAEIRLRLEAPPELTLHGPLRFVRALCQNLIDNSVNHGGGLVELTLGADPLPRPAEAPNGPPLWRIRLGLRDQGGGLPSTQKARLAEALGLPSEDSAPPLARPDRRPSAGLAVLAHALRQLGGQIRIEDRGPDGEPLPPGSSSRVIGTIFSVSFSLPGAPDLPPRQAPELAEAPSSAAPELVSLTGRSLLLVEDSPASRDWLAHVLQGSGAEVIAVSSAPEALALLQREAFASRIDLVLTDVTLPRINGIELTQRLLKGDVAAAQPWFGQVVGLTAHADDRIRRAGLEAGMTTVLEKPIQPSQLIRALAGILNGAAALPEAVELRPADEVLDAEVTGSLIAELSLSATLSFMQRALAEAASVHDELVSDGPGADTARRLHAATGAAGLTGMILLEQKLRATEAAVEAVQAAPDLASTSAPMLAPMTEAEISTGFAKKMAQTLSQEQVPDKEMERAARWATEGAPGKQSDGETDGAFGRTEPTLSSHRSPAQKHLEQVTAALGQALARTRQAIEALRLRGSPADLGGAQERE